MLLVRQNALSTIIKSESRLYNYRLTTQKYIDLNNTIDSLNFRKYHTKV